MNELLREIENTVALDSSQRGGGHGVVAYFRDMFYFGEFGVFEQSIYANDGEQTNIIGVRGPAGASGGVLLCAPLRTNAPERPEAWTENQGNPLRLANISSQLYGAGVLSGKVDLLCKMVAAQRVPREQLVRPVLVAGLFGGELSAEAGGGLLMDHPHVRPQVALVGHPTNLEIGVEHLGHLVFRLSVRRARNIWRMGAARSAWVAHVQGRAAHGATPHLGDNAIISTLGMLSDATRRNEITIHNLRGGRVANAVPARCEAIVLSQTDSPPPLNTPVRWEVADDRTDLSYPVNDALAIVASLRKSVEALLNRPPQFDEGEPEVGRPAVWNLGQIETRPDGVELTYEFRASPDVDVESLVASLEGFATRANLRDTTHEVRVELMKDQPPFSSVGFGGDRKVVEQAKRELRKAGVVPCETECLGHTEAWIFNACGIDTLVFGAGMPGHAPGQPHERVSLQQLEAATRFYEGIIRELCCG